MNNKKQLRMCLRVMSVLLVLAMLINDIFGGGTIVLAAETQTIVNVEADHSVDEKDLKEEIPDEQLQESEIAEEDSQTESFTDNQSQEMEISENDLQSEDILNGQIQDVEENTLQEGAVETDQEEEDFLADDEPQTVLVLEEDIAKRASNVKYFRNEDNSYTAAIYPYPIHFEEGG